MGGGGGGGGAKPAFNVGPGKHHLNGISLGVLDPFSPHEQKQQ